MGFLSFLYCLQSSWPNQWRCLFKIQIGRWLKPVFYNYRGSLIREVERVWWRQPGPGKTKDGEGIGWTAKLKTNFWPKYMWQCDIFIYIIQEVICMFAPTTKYFFSKTILETPNKLRTNHSLVSHRSLKRRTVWLYTYLFVSVERLIITRICFALESGNEVPVELTMWLYATFEGLYM